MQRSASMTCLGAVDREEEGTAEQPSIWLEGEGDSLELQIAVTEYIGTP